MLALASALAPAQFRKQMGPFALVRRPPKELLDTQKMGLPMGAQHTVMARPEEISKGILSLLFEFEDLEVATLPPLQGVDELAVGRLPDCDLVIEAVFEDPALKKKVFAEILDGKHDDLPEQAFYMVGNIEEAREQGEKLAKEDR